MRVAVLGFDPGPRLGARLVLQPAIGIDDLDSVQDLPDVVLPRGGRCGSCALGAEATAPSHEEAEKRGRTRPIFHGEIS